MSGNLQCIWYTLIQDTKVLERCCIVGFLICDLKMLCSQFFVNSCIIGYCNVFGTCYKMVTKLSRYVLVCCYINNII
uniref:Putative ovule protein n=1 Tax=Solanum chacoense TaxID=4108 RepID=A0A0V0H7A1_SOLCH